MAILLEDQNECVEELLAYYAAGSSTVGLFAATGFGKSMVALVATLLQTKGHIFILTPRNSISTSWWKYGGRDIVYERENGSKVTVHVPPVELINSENEKNLTSKFLNFLGHDKDLPEEKRRVLLVHYTTAIEAIQQNPDYVRGKFLILDEGHHTTEQEVAFRDPDSLLVKQWRHTRSFWEHHGGKILLLTATPGPEEYDRIPFSEKSMWELMLRGRAPQHFLFDTIYDEDEEARIQKLVEGWVAEGRPSAIVRVQVSKEEENRTRVTRLLRAFQAQSEGVPIVDVTYGKGTQDLNGFQNSYDALTATGSPVNYQKFASVFIDFTRLTEGTDLPWVSHIYFFGVPQNKVTLDQTIGRAARYKIGKFLGYPERWVNTTKVVLVTNRNPRDRDPDPMWVELCRRFVSYRNLMNLFQDGDFTQRGLTRKELKTQIRQLYCLDQAFSETQAFEYDLRTRRIPFRQKDLLIFVRLFLERRYKTLAAAGTLNSQEQLDFQVMSTSEGKFDTKGMDALIRKHLLRAEDKPISNPLFDVEVSAHVIQAFKERAWLGEYQRGADSQILHEVSQVSGSQTKFTKEEVHAFLVREGYPSWREINRLHQPMALYLKVEHKIRNDRSLGELAVSLADSGFWASTFSLLTPAIAEMGLEFVRRRHPEVAYFRKAEHVSSLVLKSGHPLVSQLTLSRAHEIVSEMGVTQAKGLTELDLIQYLGGSDAE